jgi:hypothetical protein
MNQLELSIIVDDKDEQILAELGIDAQIISMHWATYWKDILNIALSDMAQMYLRWALLLPGQWFR